MLNKTKSKLDNVISEYPEYRKSLVALKPLLEIATDLSKEKVVNFTLVSQMIKEVSARIRTLEILMQYN